MACLQIVAGNAGCAALAGAVHRVFPAFPGTVSGKASAFFGCGGAAGSGVLAIHFGQAAAKALAEDLSGYVLSAAKNRSLVEEKTTSHGKKEEKQKNIGKKFGNPLEKDSRIDV